MATQMTVFPAPQLGKGFFQDLDRMITILINIGHITTASTIAELQTAISAQLSGTDPR